MITVCAVFFLTISDRDYNVEVIVFNASLISAFTLDLNCRKFYDN